MAIQTFTLTIRERTLDGNNPTSVNVVVYPLASNDGTTLKEIKDTTGQVVLSGHAVKKVRDKTGAACAEVTLTLPDPRDTTLNPTGFGFRVHVSTNYFSRPAVVFGSVELDAHESGGVLYLEDVTEVDPADFGAVAQYASSADLAAEASLRVSGDAATLAAAEAYSDAHGGAVASVNGHTGTVVLGASDVGADVSGAAATAQAAAIAAAATDATSKVAAETTRATTAEGLKAPIASPTFTGTVSGVTKAMVGLGSVDNTADSAKPVSTAQAAADALALAKASNLSDLPNAGTARTNLGLGTAATHAHGDYVPSTAVSIVAGTTQTAMDAAITAVATTGGTVIFPPGDYTGTINLTANKPISLLGYGATIKAQTTGAELIKFHQGDGNTIIGASARGFILDANGQTGVVGLSYEDTDGAVASDLFIKNCSVGVLFHTVASGKWVERCALANTFLTGCTTGVEFRKETAAMPSFNECALTNVGISQSSSIGIKQGAGCDFTRTTWDNVTVWCPDNAIGVEFAGRLDFARLQFGVESLGAGTGAKAIHIATTYTNYADPYAHDVEASIVGTFAAGRIVDDSTGGFGIVVRDGQNVISTGLGPALFAYRNGDAYPKVKIGVAGIEFGPGNAATTAIVQSFYADYFKSFGHLLFQADPGFPFSAANGGSASKAVHVYGTDDTYAGYMPIYATSDGPAVVPSNTQTGTTYTLVAADAGKAVTLNNASAITLTVPPNSSVAYTIGTVISLEQLGAGQVTVAAGAGVTINSRGALSKIAGQYGAASLRKIATDTWLLAGDLA